MRKIREVLRLKHACGRSNREIAKTRAMGRTAVADYLWRAKAAGLSWPLPAELDDAELERRLFPPPVTARAEERPQPDGAYLHRELRRKGVTLALLWEEYKAAHPEGYQYSRFCELYRSFERKLKPTMRQVHKAGEKAFVDFSGKQPEIVNPETGEIRPVELFVGVLGASDLIYAQATLDQTLESWIGAHVRMVEFWGGCVEIFVPDNLKSGVTKASRYEPGLNRTYEDFARHYGAAVIPTRPYSPRDKPKVETSVLIAQRWILARLRNETFFSLGQLNAAIRTLLDEANRRPMQKLGVSRRELFETIDRPALQSLPPNRFELGEWSYPTVNIDYHVEVDRNYYSVPYQLLGEKLEARVTRTTVEIFFKSRRVASHQRLRGRGRHVTDRRHMPASHRAHAEWTPSRIISWAAKTGPATAALVTKIIESRPHPEQGYRASLGIMRLGKGHGTDRLEAACRRALQLRAYNYRTIKNILRSGMDRLPPEEDSESTPVAPVHGNIRGAAYYDQNRKENVSC
ncbi:MAG: IS21 family transposase [Candidatus Eisenbacteria bacterium]|nr:IS21 family transposase [Candidatus Eisenbacteria bacterium]